MRAGLLESKLFQLASKLLTVTCRFRSKNDGAIIPRCVAFRRRIHATNRPCRRLDGLSGDFAGSRHVLALRVQLSGAGNL